jgi:hypothetical protein
MIAQRHPKANNTYVPEYDSSQPSNHVTYLDANNIYGWAMSQGLPVDEFRRLEKEECKHLNTNSVSDDSEEGFILEVDLDYPPELHDLHNEYPLAPEKMKVAENMLSSYAKKLLEDIDLKGTSTEKLFLQGLSENLNDDSFIDTRYPSVIVIDDLMRDATNSKDVCELFVDGSNHRNISVTCILQNGFSKGKENRTISINTQYIVLFKNPKDQIGPAILARQMYPSHPKKFMIKYTEATKIPYEYLFIDLRQNTPEEDRLKTDIFDSVPNNKSCSPNMVGGRVEEYINRNTREVRQFEDKVKRGI